jgi:predicted HicB family RNase H-like nuclease
MCSIGQSCHGATEAEVLRQLKAIVEEWVEILLTDGKPLPKAISDREFSGKFVVRLTPDEHKRVALKAMARGENLNQFAAETPSRA